MLLAGCAWSKGSPAAPQAAAYALEEISESGSYSLVRDGQTLGLFTRYELDAPDAGSKISSMELVLQELGIFDFENPPASCDFYMLSRGNHSDWVLSFGTKENETSWYYYVFDTWFYELRFDPTCTDFASEETLAYIQEHILPELP